MWAHKTHPDWLTAGTGAGQISWGCYLVVWELMGWLMPQWTRLWWTPPCMAMLDSYNAQIMSDSVCRRGSVHRMEEEEGILPFNWNWLTLKLWSTSIKRVSSTKLQHIYTFSHLPVMESSHADSVVLVFFAQVLRYPSEISASTPTYKRRVEF